MKYAYYPGCSLTSSAVEYDLSTRAVLAALGVEIEEIPDWTCCGASSAENVGRLMSLALPARNLALAERDLPGLEVLAPCSACYLNLRRARETARASRTAAAELGEALDAEGLTLAAEAPVRHLLDVLVNDIGAQRIQEACTQDLTGLSVAPYYGCQALRPYADYDDPNRPTSMNDLISALGATPLDWDMGARCCGASLMVTHKEVALEAVGAILGAVRGAHAVVTVCPMCQLNLEAHQGEALARAGGGERVSVLYLPQLIGLGLGLDRSELGLDKNLCVTGRLRAKLWRIGTPPAMGVRDQGEEAGIQPPGTGG
ncbi:MAG: CoB--CoM heterodisulfide reductase iron-sulfur subunit B family protein [Desulfovibrio sp.]